MADDPKRVSVGSADGVAGAEVAAARTSSKESAPRTSSKESAARTSSKDAAPRTSSTEDAARTGSKDSAPRSSTGSKEDLPRKNSKDGLPKRKSKEVKKKGSIRDSVNLGAALGATDEDDEPFAGSDALMNSEEELKAARGSKETLVSGEQAESGSKVTMTIETTETQMVPVEPEEDGRFIAEPLHVRYLCKLEHRRAVKDIKAEEAKWTELNTELTDPNTSADRRKELEAQMSKLNYQNRLRQQRFERLSQLNPKTHEELPAQLIQAARDGDSSFVLLAHEAKVDMDVQDKDLEVTPLIMATVSNKINVVKLLLELKANPRVQDVNGATCVHYAVQLDHVHALTALMDANPGEDWDNLTQKDSRSMSPIDYARRPERSACLRLLMNRMGGPVPVAWQVFKGWLSDKTGCCRPKIIKQTSAKKGGCACSCTDVLKAKK